MPAKSPSLSVLIATYNRAPVLRETLEALLRVERSEIECEIVVIDNNSTDDTFNVARAFQDRLPLRLLRETRPGKNGALNKALRECALKEIVVFADDDVTPASNWFHEIAASTLKWPQAAAFGGKIEILWPDHRQPEWAEAEWIRIVGFAWHHYGEQEVFYQPPACPFGGNYWVRRSVFQEVRRFDESIGPRPTDRIMGSETSFLLELQRAGLQMLYCPTAVVRHRIQPKECCIPALRRRGFTFGRGQIRLHGWHRRQVLARSRVLWGGAMAADYLLTSLRFLAGALHPDSRRNCERTVSSMVRFGQLAETRRLVWESFRSRGRIAPE